MILLYSLFSAFIFGFGYLSEIPNIMMCSDPSVSSSSNTRRITVALTASHCFKIAGIMGLFNGIFFPIQYCIGALLLSIGIQACAFFVR